MATEGQYERVEEDSPERCQASIKHGQCRFKRFGGTDFCFMHGGSVGAKSQVTESKRMFRLAQWQDRMGQFADAPQVKSLREEIGILRMTLEAVVQQCATPQDLLMFSTKISDMAIKLEKLVSSCHRLETSTGMLLDKASALHLASTIVTIIGRHVKDHDAIDAISTEIVEEIVRSRTKEEK